MKLSVTNTLDTLCLAPERRAAIRAALQEQGETPAALHRCPRPRRWLGVALAAALLAGACFAAEYVFRPRQAVFLGGGAYEETLREDGTPEIKIRMLNACPVKTYWNKICFTFDGSGRDITAQCSETEYYCYETTENGRRHVILVGGTAFDLGWGEYIWDEEGSFLCGTATYDSQELPLWLQNAFRELGISSSDDVSPE